MATRCRAAWSVEFQDRLRRLRRRRHSLPIRPGFGFARPSRLAQAAEEDWELEAAAREPVVQGLAQPAEIPATGYESAPT